jgi:hypothetical protein
MWGVWQVPGLATTWKERSLVVSFVSNTHRYSAHTQICKDNRLSHSPTRAFDIESGYQSSTLVPFVLVGQSTRSSRKMHIRDGAGYQILVIKTPKSDFLIMSIGNSSSYQPDSDSIDLVSQSPPWYSLRMRGRKLNFRKMHTRDGARYQPGD